MTMQFNVTEEKKRRDKMPSAFLFAPSARRLAMLDIVTCRDPR